MVHFPVYKNDNLFLEWHPVFYKTEIVNDLLHTIPVNVLKSLFNRDLIKYSLS